MDIVWLSPCLFSWLVCIFCFSIIYQIVFKTDIYGTFRQSVIFDFGLDAIVVRETQVESAPVTDPEKLSKDLVLSTANRWTHDDVTVVPFTPKWVFYHVVFIPLPPPFPPFILISLYPTSPHCFFVFSYNKSSVFSFQRTPRMNLWGGFLFFGFFWLFCCWFFWVSENCFDHRNIEV